MTKEKKLTKEELKIIKLWEEGYSGTQIGIELGMTRNAVMGKIYRLRKLAQLEYGHTKMASRAVIEVDDPVKKIEEKPKNAKIPKKASRPKLRPVVWTPKPDPSTVKIPERGVTFFSLRPGRCRYPLEGDSLATYVFCGAPATNKSYCKEHHQLCYIPPSQKRTGNPVRYSIKKGRGYILNDDSA